MTHKQQCAQFALTNHSYTTNMIVIVWKVTKQLTLKCINKKAQSCATRNMDTEIGVVSLVADNIAIKCTFGVGLLVLA